MAALRGLIKLLKLPTVTFLVTVHTCLLLLLLYKYVKTSRTNYSTSSQMDDSLKSPFINYDVTKPPVIQLEDDLKSYFITHGGKTCLKIGTDVDKSQRTGAYCMCRKGWYGPWCSFPRVFRNSIYPGDITRLTLRTKPRRIICGTTFNMEFEMQETRFAEHGDIVDLFLVAESNFTGFGIPKPLRFLDKLRLGYMPQYHSKIAHVFVDNFPEKGREYGQLAEVNIRNHLGIKGLEKQVKGLRRDDIFIYLDADEIPTVETLIFLKLHDGYPEPFGFTLIQTTYGYFWSGGDGSCPIMSGCTIGMLRHVFRMETARVRDPDTYIQLHDLRLRAYLATGGYVRSWKFGTRPHFAGWHCSWCFDVERMRIKLTSAINADFPRWGDYPEKLDPGYIRNLIKRGMWFDDKSAMTPRYENGTMYAPGFVTRNPEKFKFLIKNPYT